MTASEAAEYCENLGGSWSLPTIDELRTLVKNCDALKPEGDCKVSEYCFTSTSSCYDSGICGCGSSSEEGYYSSLRDNERLWSKTATSKTKTHIWSLDFKSASPIAVNSAARVRCVRHRCDTQNWDDNEKKCVLPERRTKSCGTLPDEYAEWNSASEILQTWNSYTWSWEPPITPQYNETASQAECKYKCKQYYVRENSKCRLQECGTNGTPCLDSTNHLIWGPRNYDYSNSQASTICGETEYLGFTDWRLPTIDELRTLLVNADGGTPRSAACQVSEANNCLSWDACWDCVNCTEQRTLLSNGTCSSSSVEFGNFCKLLGSSSYWSSSLEPDTTNAWYVNCTYGEVLRKDANDSSSMYFCCVKSAE